jgi:DNA-directed RNA polymerase subunit RPC12/RpoP
MDPSVKHVTENKSIIYVLRLQCQKYYVGKTDKSVEERFIEHMTGSGSKWTEKYEPLEILESHPSNDDYDEDKCTLEMMGRYGIDNVRGGSFVTLELSKEQMEVISKMIKSAEGRCFRCGSDRHFIKDCPHFQNKVLNMTENKQTAPRYQNEVPNERKVFHLNNMPSRFSRISREDNIRCHQCGRLGHIRPECYAKTDIYGNPLFS